MGSGEFEAYLQQEPDVGATVDHVFVPLADGEPEAPDVLEDPLLEFPGTWYRQSPAHERPARYVRVDT